MSIVSTNTIDLVTQAAYKTKVITKTARTAFGQQLVLGNLLGHAADSGQGTSIDVTPSVSYTFTPFPRKYKRAAAAAAIRCLRMCSEGAASFEGSEIERLLNRIENANAKHAGYRPETERIGATDDNCDPVYDYNGERVMVNAIRKSAADVMWDALTAEDAPELPWWDITAEQRDPDVEEDSVMVASLASIRRRREEVALAAEEERLRIRRERMAADAANNDDPDDDDNDDWEDEDDED